MIRLKKMINYLNQPNLLVKMTFLMNINLQEKKNFIKQLIY